MTQTAQTDGTEQAHGLDVIRALSDGATTLVLGDETSITVTPIGDEKKIVRDLNHYDDEQGLVRVYRLKVTSGDDERPYLEVYQVDNQYGETFIGNVLSVEPGRDPQNP